MRANRDRRRAHRARLQRDIKIAIREPRLCRSAARRAQHQHLGMRGRIVPRLDLVAGRAPAPAPAGSTRTAPTGTSPRARRARFPAPLHGGRNSHSASMHPRCLACAAAPGRVDPRGPGRALHGAWHNPSSASPSIPSRRAAIRRYPWYALRENYCERGRRARAACRSLLPHEPELAADYLDRIDGLVVTGGAFDVDPALFGAPTRHATVTTKDAAPQFELAIDRARSARDMPVLGICGGQQLLERRARRHADPAHSRRGRRRAGARAAQPAHRARPCRRDRAGHAAAPDRRRDTSCAVNSAHHQAVKESGARHRHHARAPDGVIEGIEDPRHRFCLGVQWHPEYRHQPGDRRIFARVHRRLPAMSESRRSDARRRRRASASPSSWPAPGFARAATPSAGSPRAASRSTARAVPARDLVTAGDRVTVDGKPLPESRSARGCGAITSPTAW